MKKEAEQSKNNADTNQDSVAGTSITNQNAGLGQQDKGNSSDAKAEV